MCIILLVLMFFLPSSLVGKDELMQLLIKQAISVSAWRKKVLGLSTSYVVYSHKRAVVHHCSVVKTNLQAVWLH